MDLLNLDEASDTETELLNLDEPSDAETKLPVFKASKCIQPPSQPEITLDFSKPWKMSDLVLSVEGKQLHVHRAILAISSPVFEKMLSSNFKEKNAKEIPLPDKKVEEIEGLLRAIYPYCEHVITRQTCCYLLELSYEYQMDELKKRCEKFVLDNCRPRPSDLSVVNSLCGEEALQFVVMSQRHPLSEKVVKRCITTFVSAKNTRWESLKGNTIFSQLEPQTSQRVMEERITFLENRLQLGKRRAKMPSSPTSIVKRLKRPPCRPSKH